MSRTKKLTFNMLAAKAPKNEKAELKIDWMDDAVVYVQHTLPIDEAISFVNEVVASCFDEESGEYMPEAFDFVVKVNMLVCYAGFDAPKDIKKAYSAVYTTDICTRVLDMIDQVQYYHLVDAAVKKIEHRKSLAVSSATEQVQNLIAKMTGIMEDGTRAMEKMQTPEFAEAMQRVYEAASLNDPNAQPRRTVPFAAKAPLIQVKADG